MLPISIIAIITIVLILIFFYQQSVETSNLHRALRCEAGKFTERTVYYCEDDLTDANIEVKSEVPFKVVYGSLSTEMSHRGLLYRRVSHDIESSWHAADGVKLKRLQIE